MKNDRKYVPGTCPELFLTPSIFLSASIPPSGDPAGASLGPGQFFARGDEPQRIRDAVSHLCRFVFQSGMGLIFGAHPAIAPMVLSAATRFIPQPPDAGPAAKRVIIFQSAFFEPNEIPRATLDLADWTHGELLLTARKDQFGQKNREDSLTHMREAMIGSPNILGAVFIGGMDGILEEARLCQKGRPAVPCYAVGSTGGAAQYLLARAPDAFCGNRRHITSAELNSLSSYPVVMDKILQDLGIP